MVVGNVTLPGAGAMEETLRLLALLSNPDEVKTALKRLNDLIAEANAVCEKAAQEEASAVKQSQAAIAAMADLTKQLSAARAEQAEVQAAKDQLDKEAAQLREAKYVFKANRDQLAKKEDSLLKLDAALTEREQKVAEAEKAVHEAKEKWAQKMAAMRALEMADAY